MITIVKAKSIAAFPLAKSPLIHCITNDISLETVANAILYVGAKPFMADYPAEFADVFQQTDSLLLNLGHLSEKQVDALRQGVIWASKTSKPTVLDVVGVSAASLRNKLAHELLEKIPHLQVIKGNISEMRTFAGLSSHGRGVDNNSLDQVTDSLSELRVSLQKQTQKFPETIFLATGAHDLVVSAKQAVVLTNGVPQLDRFTGSGDIVGALIATLLGTNIAPWQAVIQAVSYFNLCGEQAACTARGLASFRQATLDQLSLLSQDSQWLNKIKFTSTDDRYSF